MVKLEKCCVLLSGAAYMLPNTELLCVRIVICISLRCCTIFLKRRCFRLDLWTRSGEPHDATLSVGHNGAAQVMFMEMVGTQVSRKVLNLITQTCATFSTRAEYLASRSKCW